MILRDASPARLLSCVRAATGGGVAISAELLGRTMESAREDPSDPQLTGGNTKCCGCSPMARPRGGSRNG